MAKVVNVRQAERGSYVYVGRAMPGFVASEWANPHKMRNQSQAERARVIEAYRQWLWRQLQDPGAVERLKLLAGHDLGCWCAPKQCHGEVLLRAIEWACTQ